MQHAWMQRSGAAAVAVLALLAGPSLRAADDGVTPVVEELDKRTKAADEPEESKGLSDSAVRVLLTYAFSILPDEYPGPDGKTVKVDKSDPNKFLIPTEDARRVIRAATRSAYAEVCKLLDLERANYRTLMKSEEAKKTWSKEQLLMINALHMFSVSYFAGNMKITMKDEEGETGAPPAGPSAAPESKDNGPAQDTGQSGDVQVIAPKRPDCPPEQKQKVMNAINAYVQAAQAAPSESSPPPPATGASN
jgi:hypothetical protein